MRAWDSLAMDDDMLAQGNLSRDEAWLVLHFLEHAHNARVYAPPPPPAEWQSSPHTMHRCYGCSTVRGKQGAACTGTRHMSVCW